MTMKIFWNLTVEMLPFWKKFGLGVLFLVVLLASLTAGLWFYLSYDYIPCLIELPSPNDPVMEFDFIIVGAGTAGSVMAYHLSTYSNYSVLVIESGDVFSALSIVPVMSTFMQQTKEDWNFRTTREKYSSFGLNDQQQVIPRGKGLGGSSQINYMLHFEGIESDFEKWVQLGATNWNYNDLKFWLHRHRTDGRHDSKETCRTDEIFEGPLQHSSFILEEFNENLMTGVSNTCPVEPVEHNRTRLPTLAIKKLRVDEPLPKALLEVNAIFQSQNRPLGFQVAEFTIKNGIRWNAYHEFLRPAAKQNKNLKILKTTRVHKILFDSSKRATHVLVSPDRNLERLVKIRARKEIILSAGAIQSPQLLKVSGVGPAEELKKFHIPLVHDSPRVGTNYFDHLSHLLFMSIKKVASVTKSKILTFKTILDYVAHGDGLLSTTAVVGVGTAKNDTFSTILFGMGSADEDALRAIGNYRQDTFRGIFPLYQNASQEGVIFLSSCHLPKSRGAIRLRSSNTSDHPEIESSYLADKYDVECMRRGIRFSVETAQTKPFVELGAKIFWPKLVECAEWGPTDKDFQTNHPSDEYLECLIRTSAVTTYHPGGTCAIGNSEDSVLDNNLRVQGVTSLRVVDGSVFPAPVSGTPNSIIIAIAERAAHLVLQQQNEGF